MKGSRIAAVIASVITAVAFAIIPMTAMAAGTNAGSTDSTTVQGYASASPLQAGTIVQLEGTSANQVAAATKANLQNMYGVTVDPAQLLTNVSSNLQNEAYVAVTGTYNVLVSTEGGTINTGDYITLSSLDGIGMKASTDQSTVFGRAEAPFTGNGVTLGTQAIKDTSGATIQTVTLGSIPVSINIEHNPLVKSTKENLPPWLEKLGQQIAQKQVSPFRVYLSMGITAVSLITSIVMLYSGVRSAVISIGRNPMSKKSIFRALLEVILTSILILIIGLFAVYLLLKL